MQMPPSSGPLRACSHPSAAISENTVSGEGRMVRRAVSVIARANLLRSSLHEPAVADDDGLTGEGVGREAREEHRQLRDIAGCRELAVHGLLQHDLLHDVLFADTEFLGLLRN